jgi:hypothetical protein
MMRGNKNGGRILFYFVLDAYVVRLDASVGRLDMEKGRLDMATGR